MGRPSTFTQEALEEICSRLSDGEPLRQICRDEHMPAWQTVYLWRRTHKEVAERIALAREIGFDAIAERTHEILEQPPERIASEHGSRVDPGYVQWVKARADHHLKLLAKWDPKRYGDRIDHTHANPDGSAMRLLIGSTSPSEG